MSSPASEVAFLARALKVPRIPDAARVLAERARDESWDYQAHLAAVLTEEVSFRETHGGQARVKRARFPRSRRWMTSTSPSCAPEETAGRAPRPALLPGSVARTDLIASDQTESLARSLYRSITENLLTPPDDLPVYPTHGRGATFCSVGGGADRTSTTIGEERRSNPLLAESDEDSFVQRLLGGYGSYPAYFLHLGDINARGPRVYGERPPPLIPLDAGRVRDMMRKGLRW